MKWVLALMVSMPIVSSCGTDSGQSRQSKVSLSVKGGELAEYNVGAAKGDQFLVVEASGEWNIIVTSEVSGGSWIKVHPSSGTGSRSNVILEWEANGSEQSRTAVLTLKASGSSATLTLTQAGKSETPEPTPGPNPNPNPNPGPSEIKAGWLELPAMPEDSKFGFFSHDMKLGDKRIRNYSFAWDYTNLVAPWVAYPLNSSFTVKNVERSNAWGLDPKLPRNKQPVLIKGYRDGNDGWKARGHQLPSADRLCSYEANSRTFYGTNMTPQIHEGFNSGIWSNLEEKVRSWSRSSDTLYVVTGCVTEGSKKYCNDNDGKKVTIPTAYYKAVLRYKKNSTVGYSDYMACAVWLKHEVYSSKSVSKQYAMSIDELEKKIGIDLFANLPAAIGEDAAAKVEAEDPATVSWWW